MISAAVAAQKESSSKENVQTRLRINWNRVQGRLTGLWRVGAGGRQAAHTACSVRGRDGKGGGGYSSLNLYILWVI